MEGGATIFFFSAFLSPLFSIASITSKYWLLTNSSDAFYSSQRIRYFLFFFLGTSPPITYRLPKHLTMLSKPKEGSKLLRMSSSSFESTNLVVLSLSKCSSPVSVIFEFLLEGLICTAESILRYSMRKCEMISSVS